MTWRGFTKRHPMWFHTIINRTARVRATTTQQRRDASGSRWLPLWACCSSHSSAQERAWTHRLPAPHGHIEQQSSAGGMGTHTVRRATPRPNAKPTGRACLSVTARTHKPGHIAFLPHTGTSSSKARLKGCVRSNTERHLVGGEL
jgi:hypothetical protein